MKVRPCLHCKRATLKGLWCETCVMKSHATMRREHRKHEQKREVYKELDWEKYSNEVRIALENKEKGEKNEHDDADPCR